MKITDDEFRMIVNWLIGDHGCPHRYMMGFDCNRCFQLVNLDFNGWSDRHPCDILGKEEVKHQITMRLVENL